MYNKYNLRSHIHTIEKYIATLMAYKDIDFYRRTIVCNELLRRVDRIKGYLSIPVKKPVKVSLRDMVRSNLEYI